MSPVLKNTAECWFFPRWHLAEWHRNAELMGRYLSDEEKMKLQYHCDGCMSNYLIMSSLALETRELLFPIRPKLHETQQGLVHILGTPQLFFLIVHVNILASNQPHHTVAKGFQEIAQTQHEDGRWAGLITVFMLNHILNPLSFGIEIIYTCFLINDFSWTYFI